ncbi:MAG: hypothetical protein K0R25_1358 [Rickettsiaceae bacterium]|jgi:hypothetical protein|nr:hypothetical protein [Rickettsiaceae bacterium]
MINKKKFTISIGEYGAIVVLHDGKKIQNKILVSTLNDENKKHLKELFTKHKLVPTYVLLDTVDQNYRRVTYPLVNVFDFHKIAKRNLEKDKSKTESFYNYYGTQNKKQRKWECVFISAQHSTEVDNWVEFLLEMPNQLVGVYMLPIESHHLLTSIIETIKTDHKIKIDDKTIFSFIVDNKISGVRHIVFNNQMIVFTRVVNYNFDDQNFPHQFEQDILHANEYLKMIFQNLRLQDIVTINILPDEVIEKIKHIGNKEVNFISYSPHQISTKLGLVNATSKSAANFSDIVIANYFANSSKKICRFMNPHISFFDKMHMLVKFLSYAQIILIAGIFLTLAKSLIEKYNLSSTLSKVTIEKASLIEQYQSVNNAASEGGYKTKQQSGSDSFADEIVEFGKVNEVLSKSEVTFASLFDKLSIIKKYGVIANSFSYQITDYNPKLGVVSGRTALALSGEISDQSGNVETLLKKFDTMSLETKKQLPQYNIKYSEVAKGVDFSKKYYFLPFDLNAETNRHNQ